MGIENNSISFKPAIDYNIFGRRYHYKVIVNCDGTPGFAPSTYDIEIGDVVVNFKEHQPYFQVFEQSFNLGAGELRKIANWVKRGFIKKDFQYLLAKEKSA